MKKRLGGVVCTLLILSITTISWKPANINKHSSSFKKPFSARALLEKYISNIYESAHLQESGLDLDVFEKAMTGFIDLKVANKLPQSTAVLTVVDLTKSSHEKRMWIVDVINKELVLNTWVAHGHGSGDDMATRFSDKEDSHQSSLGFYITDDVYFGKNGRSLRLDGMDAGFNAHARERAIVVHGADYVGPNAIDELGRLGRSYGCPAVAREVSDQVIDAIKDKTVLFINGHAGRHQYQSKYLNEDMAANYLATDSGNSYLANL
ncbi:murein L,D-transpeptidase catalytic domain family protein [Mucilaginibacter sp.]|uniref:murein L,D-transpeptidase catalytic domain family protein n=1 Tax=Mucilaginibacter sp. TaxID=1882438 RepID=UPI003D0E2C8A